MDSKGTCIRYLTKVCLTVFHRKHIHFSVLVILMCIILIFHREQSQDNRNTRQRDRHKRSPISLLSTHSREHFDTSKCELFDKQVSDHNVILTQKQYTFQPRKGKKIGLCLSLQKGFVLSKDPLYSKWNYHILPSIICHSYYLIYKTNSSSQVNKRKFASIQGILHFLDKKTQIGDPALYGHCSGLHHGVTLNNTCVKFNVSVETTSFDKQIMDYNNNTHREREVKYRNIQVIFLHFISREQFKLWLPETFDLIKTSSKSHPTKTFDFKKHQSAFSSDSSFLESFLYGEHVPRSQNLFTKAEKHGFTSQMVDLTCFSSTNRTAVLEDVKTTMNMCSYSYESFSDDLCTGDNFVELDSPVIDFFLTANTDSKRPRFSVIFLSLADLKSEQDLTALDNLLSRMLQTRMKMRDTATVIVSDLGYIFTRPPSASAFEKTQLSNAVLFVILGGQGHDKHNARSNLRDNQNALITMTNIHYTISSLFEIKDVSFSDVTYHDGYNSGNEYSFSRQNQESLFAELSDNRSCQTLTVYPPNMCICQGQFVQFKNDSVQVGFAEFIIGWLNNRNHQSFTTGQLSELYFYQGVQFLNPKLSTHIKTSVFKTEILIGKYESFPKQRFLGCMSLDTTLTWTCYYQDHCQVIRISHVFVDSTNFDRERCEKTLERNFYKIANDFKRLMKIRMSFLNHFGGKRQQVHLYEKCVFLLITDFVKSVSMSVINVCEDSRYSVELHLTLRHMICLTPNPVIADDLSPLELRFLTVIMEQSYFTSGRSVRYKANVNRLV